MCFAPFAACLLLGSEDPSWQNPVGACTIVVDALAFKSVLESTFRVKVLGPYNG